MRLVWDTLISVLPVIKIHFLWVLGFTVVETLLGVERRQSFRDFMFPNLQYVLLFFFLSPFGTILPSALAAGIARQFGPGLFKLALPTWSHSLGVFDWPARNLLLPFVPLFIFDFFYYWHHRLQHRVRLFWDIHRLHHSIEHLNALAAYRVHWLEVPMRVFTITIPMALFFDITPIEGAWIALVLDQLGTFIHSSLRLPLGRLTPVLTGPQLHRLHHSVQPEHRDRNYAAIFPIWDILFGSYVAPKPGEWPQTGLYGDERIDSVLKETVYPFVAWTKALIYSFRRQPDSIRVIK